MRLNKDEYYLNIAKAVSERSTCLRRKFGAVLVKDDHIISTGYNGAPRGQDNCIDLNNCYRIMNNIPKGTRYEECRAVHAEANSVINAARAGVSVLDSTLYLYGFDLENDTEIPAINPCKLCARVIINAGIAIVKGKYSQDSDKIEMWDFRTTYGEN